MKNYLPSKKFVYLLGSFIIVAIVFFVIFWAFSNKDRFFSKEDGKIIVDRLSLAGITVNQLVQKDSDGDGVLDWEETLWGTDKNKKTTFDISDSVYIANKKKELNINTDKDENGLTETEKFAREFFGSYVAMKTSGSIDANTINNFSSALGQRVVTSNLTEIYSEKDVKIIEDNSKERKEGYYQDIKVIFENYKIKGMGDELVVVSNQLTSSEIKNPDKLNPIAGYYKDFAKKIMEVGVPRELIQTHLKIANNANNTGISILSMTKMTSDPIVGLSGLAQYQKYSDELVSAVRELETKLQ